MPARWVLRRVPVISAPVAGVVSCGADRREGVVRIDVDDLSLPTRSGPRDPAGPQEIPAEQSN
ncbi:hypothetical protein [Nocardia sp. NPDC050793]|uniref:hypothetical protein n=1 Tax=Nocardia sp. NPDC050793 TaxID=3155159 RepID=UPI0033C40BE1